MRAGRRWAIVVVVVLVAGGVAAVVVAKPLGFGAGRRAPAVVNPDPTGTYTVARENLSSQTEVSATLGYAGSYTVAAPSGAAAGEVAQARQTVTQDRATLSSDEQYESDQAGADDQAVTAAQANVDTDRSTLSSDQDKQSHDCAAPSTTTTTSMTGPSSAACNQDEQLVRQDQTQLTQAEQQLASAESTSTLDHDQNQAKVDSDRITLQGDETTLASLEATAINPGTVYTWLPAVGQVIREDQRVYSVSDVPVPLLYGSITAYRAFRVGMSEGPDVGELTRDLITLGYGRGLKQSDRYSPATARAVQRWQRGLGLPATGDILLGEVVFEPGALRVTSVSATVGESADSGGGGSTGADGSGPTNASGGGGNGGGGAAVLSATSTARQVSAAIDTTEQSEVAVGDKVAITLPNNETTPGVVSSVGTVAAPGQNGGSPTVTVLVHPGDPAATGRWDQAPVTLTITTGTVADALVVPVDALRALPGGGYAVEVVGAHGTNHLVAVDLGLFDDADGMVQLTGTGLAAGQRVVVPEL